MTNQLITYRLPIVYSLISLMSLMSSISHAWSKAKGLRKVSNYEVVMQIRNVNYELNDNQRIDTKQTPIGLRHLLRTVSLSPQGWSRETNKRAGAKVAHVVETWRACRAASVVSRLRYTSDSTRASVSTRQAISRSLACSFSSTIPERKERLLVAYN